MEKLTTEIAEHTEKENFSVPSVSSVVRNEDKNKLARSGDAKAEACP